MRMFASLTLIAAMVLTTMTPAHAGPWRRRHRAAACAMQPQYQPAAIQAVPFVGTVAATVQPGGDAASFVAWLNVTRASYGLAPVAYDGGMEAVCFQNNALQAAYGLGHHHMGHARRQNSAGNMASPFAAWMNSPAHAAALLDPSVRFIGVAYSAGYWTYSAY